MENVQIEDGDNSQNSSADSTSDFFDDETALVSYDGLSLKSYNSEKTDGLYICPTFMDKISVHVSMNLMNFLTYKPPIILGICGGKGQGKSFQCKLAFTKMRMKSIMMTLLDLENANVGNLARLIMQRYQEAEDVINIGEACCLVIDDIDTDVGQTGGFAVTHQAVITTLTKIVGTNARVPVIIIANDFSTFYSPLIRDGHMETFNWSPTREDRISVCTGIFRFDGVTDEEVAEFVDSFPGQAIDFFDALKTRVYKDNVRKWISEVGVESIGKKLVACEGPPTIEQPKMTLSLLLEYGNMLV